MQAVNRRLPGLRFETQSQPLREVLPRMDVAVFVGFAAAGPLHTPVAVEEMAQFTAIFGEAAPLAWDVARGGPAQSYLAPAVAAFFRSGGRRAWVIRVAGAGAVAGHFALPGVVQAGSDGVLRPASLAARSEGSWADGLEVSAALSVQPLVVRAAASEPWRFELPLTAPDEIAPGDLLRLTYRAEGLVLFAVVEQVVAPPLRGVTGSAPGGGAGSVTVVTQAGRWFEQPMPGSPPQPPQAVYACTAAGEHSLAVAPAPLLVESVQGSVQVTVALGLGLAAAPAPGAMLRVTTEQGDLWLMVQEVRPEPACGSPLDACILVRGEGLVLPQTPPAPPAGSPVCERLALELWVRRPPDGLQRLPGLGFASAHPRYLGALPADAQLYRADAANSTAHPALWQLARTPRFPLAGVGDEQPLYLPVAAPALPAFWAAADPVPEEALARDGLAVFHAGLFLDPALIAAGADALMEEADFLRYQSPTPHRLTGIHAALALEEATIIAVPDAHQRPWRPREVEPPQLPPPSAPAPPPAWQDFLPCSLRVLPAPQFVAGPLVNSTGAYTLCWTGPVLEPPEPGQRFVLAESTLPDFGDAQVVYAGPEQCCRLDGRRAGDYYYRLRVETEDTTSDWSAGTVRRVTAPQGYVVEPAAAYSADPLLAVQRALLRMCAARGDLFAVLALPEHYQEDAAIDHVAQIKSSGARAAAAGPLIVGEPPLWVAPLGYGERRAHSYGALYHPWLVESRGDQPPTYLHLPPDGAAAGLMAARTLQRGAWVAPANDLLRAVVALTPPIARARWLDLQAAQINLLRQEARGFVVLSADTLSDDDELRPINVRRLLMLLRRLALREGTNYVFEPHSAAFRRLVQRNFAFLLEGMHRRGAFAGATPESSFQVVVSDTLNSAQQVEQGRLIVELRVAPSLPLTFLTIRLVQTYARTQVTELAL